jgi:DnaJ-class molecular chaperone
LFAALGEIEIPTLNGHAKVKIPAKTQTGTVFRRRRNRKAGYCGLFIRNSTLV